MTNIRHYYWIFCQCLINNKLAPINLTTHICLRLWLKNLFRVLAWGDGEKQLKSQQTWPPLLPFLKPTNWNQATLGKHELKHQVHFWGNRVWCDLVCKEKKALISQNISKLWFYPDAGFFSRTWMSLIAEGRKHPCNVMLCAHFNMLSVMNGIVGVILKTVPCHVCFLLALTNKT